MKLQEMFEAAHEEFIHFDKIPEAERRHPWRDLCAFLFLHEKLGGTGYIVGGANHDVIYLNYTADDCKGLTLDDVVYIHRCGVRLGNDGLEMFV